MHLTDPLMDIWSINHNLQQNLKDEKQFLFLKNVVDIERWNFD